MDINYYLMCYRTEALVASHLPAHEFGSYMAAGTRKLSLGHVMFFQVDPDLKSDYFDLKKVRQRCVPHQDGAPKRSAYVSIYRVMEHVPLKALGDLHLVTRDGRVLSISGQDCDDADPKSKENMYIEFCPATARVVSRLSPIEFVKFMTASGSALHLPRLFFADQVLTRDESGALSEDLPYLNRHHIVDCLNELAEQNKTTKTVERNPHHRALFRTINRGFYVGDQSGCRAYKLPAVKELEDTHRNWWRSALEG